MSIKQTSRDYFRSLQIVYYALIAGQVFFCAVSYFLNQTGKMDTGMKDRRDIFLVIVPLFVIGGFLSSRFIFKTRLTAIKNQDNLIAKMTDYRGALIIKYALLEGPSFFAIVVFLLTGDYLFLGLSGLIIVYFFLIRPTPETAVNDLELSIMEVQLINDPDCEIAEIKN